MSCRLTTGDTGATEATQHHKIPQTTGYNFEKYRITLQNVHFSDDLPLLVIWRTS